jgi:hypothetical protein
MKIKDVIVREADDIYKVVKTDPTSGIDLQKPNDPHTTLHLDPEAAKAIAPDPSNPNKFSMNPQAAGQSTDASKPTGPANGAEITIPTTEGPTEEPTPGKGYTPQELVSILSGQKTQQQVDAERLAKWKAGQQTEEHNDLISQGNQDVGGDGTDQFINDVKDSEFEKANSISGTDSTIGSMHESDEQLLDKMLTIAGIR